MPDYALILANDLTEPEDILRVCRLAAPHIHGVKIGLTSSLVPGAEIFCRVRDIIGDKLILADFKIGDIAFPLEDGSFDGTNARIVSTLMKWGADYVTVHAFPGWGSLQEALWAAHRAGGKVLALPAMTHAGADLFFGMPLHTPHAIESLERMGIPEVAAVVSPCRTVWELILAIGEKMGVDGFIGPANQPDLLRAFRRLTSKAIWSPGFGRQDRRGRPLPEQFREWAGAVGPSSAAIVGSLIYADPDPGEAARLVRATLEEAVASLAVPKP